MCQIIIFLLLRLVANSNSAGFNLDFFFYGALARFAIATAKGRGINSPWFELTQNMWLKPESCCSNYPSAKAEGN